MKKLKYIFDIRKEERVFDAILRSSFLNLIAKGSGYLRSVAVAVLLGFSAKTDAFFMALSLIGIFLIFADVFDSIGVPNLVRARTENREEFERLSGLLFGFTLLLTFMVGFLALVLYPAVLKIPIGFNKEDLSYTKIAYFLLIPYLLSSFIFHHFGAILRSVRRFTHYFLSQFIISFSNFLFTVFGLLAYKSWLVLPISLSIAQILGTLYILMVGKEFIYIRLYFNETTKKILKHFFYLSALYGASSIFTVTDRAFASLLGEKAVSALFYGYLVASIPHGVLRLENIAITSLAEAGGSIEKLNFYIKKILTITVPTGLTLSILSDAVTRLLFGYGAFSHTDITLTSEAVRFFSIGIPFGFIWSILYRVFQIREALKPVFFIATTGVIANILLNYLLVVRLHYGIMGICLATFGANLFLCVAGYAILKMTGYESASSRF